MKWYRDESNPLVVNSKRGDFAATALCYGAEIGDLRIALSGLQSAFLEAGGNGQHPAMVQAKKAME